MSYYINVLKKQNKSWQYVTETIENDT